jgi:hypothetical protein
MDSIDTQEKEKLIVLVIMGLIYSFGAGYLFGILPGQRYTDDFFPRWYASYKLLTINRSIYDPANAAELVELARWPFADQLRYYYPAYMLIFTFPLALVSYETARFIWTVGGLWCLWLGTALVARLLKPALSVNRLTVLLVLVTLSMPILQHTVNVQFNALGVLALALAYRALYQEKYLAAGLWAGGLLFKPQALILPLIFFLVWSLFESRRRWFWVGVGAISLVFWGVAELLEPGWVNSFRESLQNYVPIQSALEIMVGDPYWLFSLALFGLTVGAIVYTREVSARSIVFVGLLAWTICLNALIVPMYGMLHMVCLGLILVLLLSGLSTLYPAYSAWFWWSIMGFFVVGILALALPLVLAGASGVQIATTELVFRFTLPILAGLAAWPLILSQHLTTRDEVHEIICDYPRL